MIFRKFSSNFNCIFSVVTSCKELELFDFSGCDHVTVATVQAALDSVKLRTNNIKLKLIVGGELGQFDDSSAPFISIYGNRILHSFYGNKKYDNMT
jgi:hypothetical protein